MSSVEAVKIKEIDTYQHGKIWRIWIQVELTGYSKDRDKIDDKAKKLKKQILHKRMVLTGVYT
jgi:hypothetical protein